MRGNSQRESRGRDGEIESPSVKATARGTSGIRSACQRRRSSFALSIVRRADCDQLFNGFELFGSNSWNGQKVIRGEEAPSLLTRFDDAFRERGTDTRQALKVVDGCQIQVQEAIVPRELLRPGERPFVRLRSLRGRGCGLILLVDGLQTLSQLGEAMAEVLDERSDGEREHESKQQPELSSLVETHKRSAVSVQLS
jgi:hypothetical protein